MRYPKINTVWKRDLTKSHKPIIEGEYSNADFSAVDKWHVEEKAEGMNIRIYIRYENETGNLTLKFSGRSEISVLPDFLIKYLDQTIDKSKVLSALSFLGCSWMVLHGEAIGYKIQGDYYNRGANRIVLFDIQNDGRWLDRDKVYAVADMIGLEKPWYYGEYTLDTIIYFVKSKPQSNYVKDLCTDDIPIEGVVCRAKHINGDKIMKIKCKDYK